MKNKPASKTMASAKDAKLRILVVDDHPLVREGLADLINQQTDVMCCGGAGSISEAHEAVAEQMPHLVVVDLRLGDSDGLELIKDLRSGFADLRILALSQLDEFVYAERAMRAGANGYVMKEQAAAELLKAMRKVLAGDMYVSEKITAMAVRRMVEDRPLSRGSDVSALTDRELHVLKAVAAGLSNRYIAAELRLSVKTIETYREHIKYKLGLGSGTELIRYADEWARKQTGGPPPLAA